MSKHSYHKKSKKRHQTRKNTKINKRKYNKKRSKTLKQKGGGILFELIPSAQARVVYIVNFGRINIEERCQDGKADHQVWHMDVSGEIQKLNLKGQGDEYFKNPELIPSDIYKSEKGYLCSQRQLTKKEREAYNKKFE